MGGHILEIHGVRDNTLDTMAITAEQLEALAARPFSLLNPAVEQSMRDQVEAARMQLDSVGGIVEIAAVGLPAGIGSPMFDGIENRLAAALFGVPAIKGLEFGEGFGFASLRGSQANDPYAYDQHGEVVTTSNHNGGLLGGITNGMPLVMRAAVKPTSSISKSQQTIDLISGQPATLNIKGRHDPCIVPRALPVLEAMTALTLLDILESEKA